MHCVYKTSYVFFIFTEKICPRHSRHWLEAGGEGREGANVPTPPKKICSTSGRIHIWNLVGGLRWSFFAETANIPML